MGRKLKVDWNSLTVQMVFSSVILVLLTATAIGLPAIMLVRRQVELQAWAQVGQGSQASQALYAAWQGKISDLATLTAQRPTLKQLALQDNTELLLEYLQTLRQGTELDLFVVCDRDEEPIAQVGEPIRDELCRLVEEAAVYVFLNDSDHRLWFLAQQRIIDNGVNLGQVIVGLALDDEFAQQMQGQTGLDHTLLVNGHPQASSLPGGVAAWLRGAGGVRAIDIEGVNASARLSLDGQPFYVARVPLGEPGIEDEVALDVTDIEATELRLVGMLVGSMTLAVLFGLLISLFLSHRVARPLTRLAGAARIMSTGNLDTSVSVGPGVSEVTEVSRALETARIDLQRTLVKLQQFKGWTDHLLEAISEGIVTLDQAGRITFFSPGAERIIGLSQFDVLERHCDDVFKVADTDERFSLSLPQPGLQNKVNIRLASDREATLSFTGAQLTPPDTEEAGIALVFRDVSDTEVVHRLIGEFLANITHEFRTPISALAAATELLLDQTTELSHDELRELLTSLYMGIVGLQTLVDNLLESARLEAGRFQVYPRPAELGDIIGEATRIMQPLLERHNQQLVIELPADIPIVQADSRRIIQVLVNFLSNANKYGSDNTEIGLSVKTSDGWASVAVADQGPGIPQTYRSSLFRRFAHPEPGIARSRYGAGLGLSVVKAIVEAHGGQVGAEDRPGGGSVFWFTVPLEDEA